MKYSRYRTAARAYGRKHCIFCNYLFRPVTNNQIMCPTCKRRYNTKVKQYPRVRLCYICNTPIDHNIRRLFYCSDNCAAKGWYYRLMEERLRYRREAGIAVTCEDVVLQRKIQNIFYRKRVIRRVSIKHGHAIVSSTRAVFADDEKRKRNGEKYKRKKFLKRLQQAK